MTRFHERTPKGAGRSAADTHRDQHTAAASARGQGRTDQALKDMAGAEFAAAAAAWDSKKFLTGVWDGIVDSQVTKAALDFTGNRVAALIPGHHWEDRSEMFRSGDPIGYVGREVRRMSGEVADLAHRAIAHVKGIDWSRAVASMKEAFSADATYRTAITLFRNVRPYSVGHAIGGAVPTLALPAVGRAAGGSAASTGAALERLSAVPQLARAVPALAIATPVVRSAATARSLGAALGTGGSLVLRASGEAPDRGAEPSSFDRASDIAGEAGRGRQVSTEVGRSGKNHRLTITRGSDDGLEKLDAMPDALALNFKVQDGVRIRQYLVGDLARQFKKPMEALVDAAKKTSDLMWQRARELNAPMRPSDLIARDEEFAAHAKSNASFRQSYLKLDAQLHGEMLKEF